MVFRTNKDMCHISYCTSTLRLFSGMGGIFPPDRSGTLNGSFMWYLPNRVTEDGLASTAFLGFGA